MPGIVVFKRRWSFGSDDLVVPGVFLATLHFIWVVILAVLIGTVHFDPDSQCTVKLREHVLGYIVIMSCCVLLEALIACVSMRGTIINTEPRCSMQYLLYARLGVFAVELVWLITGLVWIIQHYNECHAPTPKKVLLGVFVCNWVIMLSLLLSLWCTFDVAGRSWVKLKRYQESVKERRNANKHCSGSRRRNWRHSTLMSKLQYSFHSRSSVDKLQGKAIRLYEQSWDRRCKMLFCCVGGDKQQTSFAEVARLFTDFFRDLDVVPTDIIAGLVLLRKEQRLRRTSIVKQHTNEVYEFLSGVPIAPTTRFLSLQNPEERAHFELVLHFMRYAYAAYGWPMFMMNNTMCGLCRMLPTLKCCCLCCKCCARATHDAVITQVFEDNCCSCHMAALHQVLGMKPEACTVLYCTYHVDIGETPFYIALDHAHKRVVLTIRGTVSLQDVLTDLKAEPEPIPIEPLREDWLAHKGMVENAVYIRKELREKRLLEEAFAHDPERGTHEYELCLVGHSLGGGTGAILGILLRNEYPGLHCFCFSPPGGLLSAPCVEYTKGFITSVVNGKDVVARIGLYQLETMREDLIHVIKKSDKQKWRIIGNSLCCCNSDKPESKPTTPEGVSTYDEVRARRARRYFTHPTDSDVALTSHVPLYLPGRIIHVVRTHPESSSRCGREEPVYQALWANNMDFDEVLISPTMVNDHMPESVLDALNKVLTNGGPAKPTRKYSEAERQAMLAASHEHEFQEHSNQTQLPNYHSNHNNGAPNNRSLHNNNHQRRTHFNFDTAPCEESITADYSHSLECTNPLLSNEIQGNSGLAYCIPGTHPDYGTQSHTQNVWNMERGNVGQWFETVNGGSPHAHRPRSFPPKPRPTPLRLDLQQSLDWPQQGVAPLATPETLSEASSMASVTSRGSYRGQGYQRMSAEVPTLAPIQQSPVRPTRSQVLSALNSTEQVALLHDSQPLYDVVASPHTPTTCNIPGIEESHNDFSPPRNESSPLIAAIGNEVNVCVDINAPRKLSDISDQQREGSIKSRFSKEDICDVSNNPPNQLLRHSPDSTNQLAYDWINGAYSHGGRGYPHGSSQSEAHRCRLSSEQQLNGGQLDQNHTQFGYAHNIDPANIKFTPEDETRQFTNVETNMDTLHSNNYINNFSYDANPRVVPEKLDNQYNNVPNVNMCVCRSLSRPERLLNLNGENTSNNAQINNKNIPISNEIPTTLTTIKQPSPCTCKSEIINTQSENLLLSVDQSERTPETCDIHFDQSDEPRDMRDDVSCSDSEPFMPQHPDSDSAASPLFPLLKSGLFMQESQV